jgi:GGDEF domain-containing protein
MTNLALAAIMCLVCATIFFLSYGKKDLKLAYFKLLCVSMFIWSFFTAMLFIIPDVEMAYSLYMFKYIGISFTPILIYLHIESLTSSDDTKKTALYLSIMPLITSLLCLTNMYHPWLHRSHVVVGEIATRLSIAEYGVWFYVHTVYSYTLVLLSLFKLVKVFFLIPYGMRKPFLIMIVGVTAVVLMNILSVSRVYVNSVDPTLIASALTLLLFYLAYISTNTANIIMTSREKIYFNLSSMIFVLNRLGRIIDCNYKAQELVKDLKMGSKNVCFEEFKEAWLRAAHGRISPHNRDVLTVELENRERHFMLSSKDVTENNELLGSFIEIQEITQVYELTRHLEYSAFYDALTGVSNRNAFILRLHEWDKESTLPLAIIVCDVNLLKSVNDKYGHMVGDELLVSAAEIISVSIREKADVFRIGGDEFVVLIPNSNNDEVNAVIDT